MMKEKTPHQPKPTNKTLVIVSCFLLASLVSNILAWNAKVHAEESFRYWQGENQRQSDRFKRYRDKISELKKEIVELEEGE